MKIYCINLDQNPDRLAHMQRQLGLLNLSFDRFPAVNGLAASQNLERPVLPDVGHPATPGEFGCLLSHRAIWKLVVDGSDPCVMVIEDDVLLSSKLSSFIAAFEENPIASSEFDLIKLDSCETKIIVDQPVATLAGSTLSGLRSNHFRTGGYIVSKSGSAKLLGISHNLRMVADEIFEKHVMARYGIRVYQADPSLIAHPEYYSPSTQPVLFESTIDSMGDRHARSRIRGMKKLFRELRRLWVRLCYRFVWRHNFKSKRLIETVVRYTP